MKLSKYWLSAGVVCALLVTAASSQDRTNSYGISLGLGASVPYMDINAHSDFPYARVGVRYYPSSNFGLEFGAGLSTLEADADSQFSTTTIYPLDARLIIHPLKPGKIDPFAFVGFGFTYFNPKDRNLTE